MGYLENSDEGHAEGEENLHFNYNREERLKKAPQIVQDYYSGKFKLNKGFYALVATRGNRFMLFVLVLCLAVTAFTSVFASFEKARIGKVNFKLSAFSFEEEIMVSLKVYAEKMPASLKSKYPDGIPVQASVSAFDVDKQLSSSKIVSGNFKGDELYLRTKFPDYDILTVRVEVSAMDENCRLTADVQRK